MKLWLFSSSLFLLPLCEASPSPQFWGSRGTYGNHRGHYRVFGSPYSHYSSPMAEPEPQASPRITRNLIGSPKQSPSQSQRLSHVPSQTGKNWPHSPHSPATPGPQKQASSPEGVTQGPRIQAHGPSEGRKGRTESPRETEGAGRGKIQPIFNRPNPHSIKETQQSEDGVESVVKEWVVPPSLMAVPAVPGAERRRGEDMEDMDPYLQFMPVPAVPQRDTSRPRQPKDSLNSLQLNLNLPNSVEGTETPRPPVQRAPVPRDPTPAPTPAPSQAPSPDFAPVPPNIISDPSTETRKKFKRCHGRCVQKFCLPVTELTVYQNCVDKCKSLCT